MKSQFKKISFLTMILCSAQFVGIQADESVLASSNVSSEVSAEVVDKSSARRSFDLADFFGSYILQINTIGGAFGPAPLQGTSTAITAQLSLDKSGVTSSNVIEGTVNYFDIVAYLGNGTLFNIPVVTPFSVVFTLENSEIGTGTISLPNPLAIGGEIVVDFIARKTISHSSWGKCSNKDKVTKFIGQVISQTNASGNSETGGVAVYFAERQFD